MFETIRFPSNTNSVCLQLYIRRVYNITPFALIKLNYRAGLHAFCRRCDGSWLSGEKWRLGSLPLAMGGQIDIRCDVETERTCRSVTGLDSLANNDEASSHFLFRALCRASRWRMKRFTVVDECVLFYFSKRCPGVIAFFFFFFSSPIPRLELFIKYHHQDRNL